MTSILFSAILKRNVASSKYGHSAQVLQTLFSLHLGMHRFTNLKRRIRCLSATTNSTNSVAGESEMPASSSELWLHNTMSRKKELFKPKVEGRVGMYVCGVTAYDLRHIGHARVYVTFDVLYRYLRHLGYEVTYVRNFTDVDDKILQQLKEKALKRAKLTEDQVLQKIEERNSASKNKEYEKSDTIRKFSCCWNQSYGQPRWDNMETSCTSCNSTAAAGGIFLIGFWSIYGTD
uniref:cysteine--tRNA ligase, cytoplasmic-like isoform X2 n=1 Tax=Fragaria vesca subsp. vesca TaxID=101020 RepID=UPI0005CA346F|nr:PREDICTED: cysteine--tRNA ligase, cytoplasmic-like isoform X2 [Fragaria vesca subsp. vesca]